MTIPEMVASTGFPVIDVDVLISGAGPAGASLACFLAFHGRFNLLTCTLVSSVMYVTGTFGGLQLCVHSISQVGFRSASAMG